jgi:formate-dependent phosphoribosylglycinamide formyltransferase (GAR transformylase)
MGVALAKGNTIEQARRKATQAAAKVRLGYDDQKK